MTVSPVGPGVPVPPASGVIGAHRPGPTSAKPFSQLVSNLLNDANVQQLQADQAVGQLITGEADSVHDVVLSVAKADLAFRLVLEIRNRLIDSYQEIMRMQV